MSLRDYSDDDLVIDSVPEPPRENTNTEPTRENGLHKRELKERKDCYAKNETEEKPFKPTKSKKTKKTASVQESSASSSTFHIQGNNIQIGNVFHFNLSSNIPKMEKKEKFHAKPKLITELMRNCDAVSKDQLDIAAIHIGSGWKDVGKRLGFTDGQLEQIEENCKRQNTDFKEMVYQMLLEWKHFKDEKATLGILCESLWKTEQYDAAKMLAKEVYPKRKL